VKVPFPLFVIMVILTGDAHADIDLSLSDGRYSVEIADNSSAQMRGLMGRDNLPAGQGMLFVYPRDRRVSFWMKNVRFPLDMIFLDRCGKVVQIHENAPPGDPSIITSRHPVRAVLEIAAGASRRDRIRSGDRVSVEAGLFDDCSTIVEDR